MIRRLASEDWPIWKSIRLEILQSVPEAFGASYKEDAAKSDKDWENSLVKSDIFGAFQAGILQIGLEPRALNVSRQFYDEILMMRKVDE